jgi:hypothetical protein
LISACLHSERLEILKGRIEQFVRKSSRGQSPADTHRLPSKIDIEVAQRRRDRRHGRIVENYQPAGTNEFSKKIQVDENFVEAMTTVDKGCVCGKPVGNESRERN